MVKKLNPVYWFRSLQAYRLRNSDYLTPPKFMVGWIIIMIHHVVVIAAGLAGFFIAPPPSIAAVVGGTLAAYLWSSTFILFGFFGLLARLFNRARAEVVSTIAIAAARTLWAGILLYSISAGLTDLGTLQLTLMLIAGAIFLTGWSITILVWLSGTPLPGINNQQAIMIVTLRDHLREVVDNAADEERE